MCVISECWCAELVALHGREGVPFSTRFRKEKNAITGSPTLIFCWAVFWWNLQLWGCKDGLSAGIYWGIYLCIINRLSTLLEGWFRRCWAWWNPAAAVTQMYHVSCFRIDAISDEYTTSFFAIILTSLFCKIIPFYFSPFSAQNYLFNFMRGSQ